MIHDNSAKVHELQNEIEALCTDLHVAEIKPCGSLLIPDEHHSEVRAAGRQHGLVGPEINVPYGNAAVTEETPLPLVVELLQDMLTVARPCHYPVKNRKEKCDISARPRFEESFSLSQAPYHDNIMTCVLICKLKS